MEDTRNAYKILVGKPEENVHLKYPGGDERIIIKLILKT
jgi:hypothetical protein